MERPDWGLRSLTVATANVESALPRARAAEALRLVLAHEPDLVGLQEWYAVRRPLVRESRRRTTGTHRSWVAAPSAYDGNGSATCARARCGLSRPGPADRAEGWLGLEPARTAAVVTCRDRSDGTRVAIVDYHLVSGVQARDVYRADRPRLVARHRREVDRLQRLVAGLLDEHDAVYAVGDSNLHGLRLPGLTSAWDATRTAGTLGPRRQVDDVFGPGPAARSRLSRRRRTTGPSSSAARARTRRCRARARSLGA